MHRLFVACRPPPEIRRLLLAAMGGISGARWQDEDQLHLTLRFIGEAESWLAGDVHAALQRVHHPAFDIRLAGIGSFDRRGRVEAIWAGLAPQDSIKALHGKIDQALVRAGLEPERRAYLPHITLARMGRSVGDVRGFVEMSGGLSSPEFRVDRFSLFESQLSPLGALYTEVQRYKLD